MMAAVNFASADTIRGINIDFVPIGNAGNAADTQVMSTDGTTGYGAVGHNYRIGKYEVTNAQWNSFTVTAGAPTGNDVWGYNPYDQNSYFTGAQQPANQVSWYEAAQFCNYLTSGDKSKGAYQFSGNNANPGDFLGINRDAAISFYGITYVIPTEDEWCKAAYFKPNGSGYSLYANGTNTAPLTNQTCYKIYSSPWNVGTGTMEQNGTFDMMGNVYEWNESPVYAWGNYNCRGLRGGSGLGNDPEIIKSSFRGRDLPLYEFNGVGFRIAEIPEPATICLLGFGALGLLRKRRA